MKGLRVTKNVKAIKFERVWDELEQKNATDNNSQIINHKIFETNSSFPVK